MDQIIGVPVPLNASTGILEWDECLRQMQYADLELYERCIGIAPSRGDFPYYFNKLVQMAQKCGGIVLEDQR